MWMVIPIQNMDCYNASGKLIAPKEIIFFLILLEVLHNTIQIT